MHITKTELEELERLICEEYELDRDKLYSKTRRQKYVEGRRILAYIMRKKYDCTLQRIGERMNRGHDTIWYYCETFEALVCVDPRLKRLYNALVHRKGVAA